MFSAFSSGFSKSNGDIDRKISFLVQKYSKDQEKYLDMKFL